MNGRDHDGPGHQDLKLNTPNHISQPKKCHRGPRLTTALKHLEIGSAQIEIREKTKLIKILKFRFFWQPILNDVDRRDIISRITTADAIQLIIQTFFQKLWFGWKYFLDGNEKGLSALTMLSWPRTYIAIPTNLELMSNYVETISSSPVSVPVHSVLVIKCPRSLWKLKSPYAYMDTWVRISWLLDIILLSLAQG